MITEIPEYENIAYKNAPVDEVLLARLRDALRLPDAGWRARAACLDAPTRAFYPDTRVTTPSVITQCLGCPVRISCLAEALRVNEVHGLWGATMPHERRLLRRRLRTEGLLSKRSGLFRTVIPPTNLASLDWSDLVGQSHASIGDRWVLIGKVPRGVELSGVPDDVELVERRMTDHSARAIYGRRRVDA